MEPKTSSATCWAISSAKNWGSLGGDQGRGTARTAGSGAQEGPLAQVPRRMGTIHGTSASFPPQLPPLQLFPLCGGFGNQRGVGRLPPGSGERDRSALASPSIILTHRKPETLYRATLLQLLWADEYSPEENCWVLLCCISTCRQEPALFKTLFPSNTILSSLSLIVSSRCNDKRVHRMAAVMVMWWVLAISSWISDRWLCGLWQAINFPYFHSFW